MTKPLNRNPRPGEPGNRNFSEWFKHRFGVTPQHTELEAADIVATMLQQARARKVKSNS